VKRGAFKFWGHSRTQYIRRIWRDLAGFGGIRLDSTGFGGIWVDSAGFGGIRRDSLEIGKVCVCVCGGGYILALNEIRVVRVSISWVRE
jgi:hypothetical protein